MISRRRFLHNLGIGAAALMLRFRPEIQAELSADDLWLSHYSQMASSIAKALYAPTPYLSLLKAGKFPEHMGDIARSTWTNFY